ncbi:glycine zipper 2TM domain-containing protein [Undibacterium sp. 14-3-2]|uniref:glycine zipper 2TM domain-containing protein n=1 Tax=Undibacterium sp. 14-3-2 TaxID=2800129 RepID=UPI0019039BA5|nr:glycine zipper 2TM domain-containing protein [Undibacterium sp. 14-3-2]MBK1890654.1 glycine zipper 2TM domain-containing protein [Undibacterium sp. 14-3-2]
MSDNQTNKRIHPLVAGAAVSVMLVSLIGVAAMTGVLPNSNSKTVPDNANAVAMKDAGVNNQTSFSPSNEPVQNTAKQGYRSGGYDNLGTTTTAERKPAVCDNCGVVESVRAIEQQASQGSGVGAVAGALLGGVLGNQVGGGDGRKLATVAGAVGGGFAGNAIEKRTRTTTVYEVRVKMENGHVRTFHPSAQPGWQSGDRVRIVNGSLQSA